MERFLIFGNSVDLCFVIVQCQHCLSFMKKKPQTKTNRIHSLPLLMGNSLYVMPVFACKIERVNFREQEKLYYRVWSLYLIYGELFMQRNGFYNEMRDSKPFSCLINRINRRDGLGLNFSAHLPTCTYGWNTLG